MVFRKYLTRIALAILVLFTLASLTIAGLNALSADGSQDFQYSGAQLLADGENPYRAWQIARHEFLLSQVPNYLPAIYFLLLPLGFLPWSAAKLAWLVCNLACALFVAVRLWRNPALPAGMGLWCALLFLSSTPVRNTIGNGQHGLLIMVLVIAAFRARSAIMRGTVLAVALSKYSLGAVFVAVLAGRRDWAGLAAVALATLGTYAAFAVITGTAFGPELLLAPLETARGGVSLAMPFKAIAALVGPSGPLAVSAIALAGTFLWCWQVGPHGNGQLTSRWQLPGHDPEMPRMILVASLVTLCGMPHLTYDYCLLALPFAFGNPIALLGRIGRAMFLIVLAWYWNGMKIADLLHNDVLHDAANLAMAALLLYVMIDAAMGAVRQSGGKGLPTSP